MSAHVDELCSWTLSVLQVMHSCAFLQNCGALSAADEACADLVEMAISGVPPDVDGCWVAMQESAGAVQVAAGTEPSAAAAGEPPTTNGQLQHADAAQVTKTESHCPHTCEP